MKKLSEIVQEFVIIEGACSAGIVTTETLAGGPPSSDLTYVLPGAKSAVVFAVGIDPKTIPPYLAKKDRLTYEQAYMRTTALAGGIAFHLSNYLGQKGYPSVPVADNCVYRPESSGGLYGDYPDIAHRYLAVRSGVGSMGLSGNILTKEHGAAIVLASTITTAELLPTDPLPSEENYCDNCRLCMASCVAVFMHPKEKTHIRLGTYEFEYSKRRHYGRCDCVCSGYTGLHSSGKWSTWSPGRFNIPESDDDIKAELARMIDRHAQWPESSGGRYFFYTDDKLRVSCANCQLVCCPDKDERKTRYKMLTESGVAVQNPDGTIEAVSPEDAEKILKNMPDDRRILYEDIE
ncbi:MAG: epoxyqueuosine reductase [Deltaproteobacteria bacterium]|nr:epoxyqueuosine reductase [Deltaproteobacteria bacterium]